jgi:hypothetical protein
LDLAKVQGRAADVRALVQRDRAGKWQLTGAGVRIGGGGVVSNLHAGGSAARLDVLVPRAERKTRLAKLATDIENLTLRVAQTLSRNNLLGELGVDLGVDQNGRLWIIEVNRWPGRATFKRAGLTEAWRRSGTAPLEFSLHLWAYAKATEEAEEVKEAEDVQEAVETDEMALVEPADPVEAVDAVAPDDPLPVEPQVSLGGYVPVFSRSLT